MNGSVQLDGRSLTPADVTAVAHGIARVELPPAAMERIEAAWRTAGQARSRRPAYGHATGVGSLSTSPLDPADTAGYSLRLIRSHAAGAGPPVARPVARAMLAVRLNQFATGSSGIQPAIVTALVHALNAGLAPTLRQLGGIGLGDLPALSAAGLALVGEAAWDGDGDPPARVRLGPGDGLALINSAPLTLADAALAVDRLDHLLPALEAVAGLSAIAFGAHHEAFDPRVQLARPLPGQLAAAAHLTALVEGAPVRSARIQSAMAHRAGPQLHGAVRDALAEVGQVLAVELNADTVNPLVVDQHGVLHHANSVQTRLALVLDQLRAALLALGTGSARRLSTVLEAPGLPRFLAGPEPAASGLMMLEYTAQGAVAELRAMAVPVGISWTVVSHGIEDYASYADLAARQTRAALDPLEVVVAAELVAAVRALRMLDLRPPSVEAGAAFDQAAAVLSAELADRSLTADLDAAAQLLHTGLGHARRTGLASPFPPG